MSSYSSFTEIKFNYIAFAVGFGLLTTGTCLMFFGRNYVYDYTNKDLFLPFGILLIVVGAAVMLIFSVRIGQEWIQSTDFTKLNEMREEAIMPPLPQLTLDAGPSPQHSLMTGAYSGYNLNSPI